MMTDGEHSKSSRPKPRAVHRRTRRTRANPNPEGEVQEEQEQTNDEQEHGDEQAVVTPKAKRTQPPDAEPSSAPREAAEIVAPPAGGDMQTEEEAEGAQSAQYPPSTPAGASEELEGDVRTEETAETPKVAQAKKRTREDDIETEASPLVDSQGAETPGHDRPSTPVDDVQIRRKRVRRR